MTKLNWQPRKVDFWHKFPAPARPWPSEVKIFESYVLEKKAEGKMDVLVLGSTVEFRSMLHKNGMNVHVADFSRDFYNILTETQKDRLEYTDEEKFYEENWLTMDLGKQFELIFGDWVPGVLHTKDYDKFFDNVARHLKDDGLFIGRECLRPDRSEVDIIEVAKKHNKEYADKYSFYESSMQYIYAYRPYEDDMWNMPAAQEALDLIHKEGLLGDDEYKFFSEAIAIERDASASIMVQEDFDREVEKYFDILAKHHVDEPSSEWYPIYVMKKK